jgi:hypothetical protein
MTKITINMVPIMFTPYLPVFRQDIHPPSAASLDAAPSYIPLHRDADCNSDIGIPAVVHVVAVVGIDDINVVVVVPVISPILRPRVKGTDPIATVLEARVSAHNFEGKAVDAKSMVLTKVSAETVIRDAIAAIPATLLPSAMVGVPTL